MFKAPSLPWYFNRLIAMSPGELKYRINQLALTRREKQNASHLNNLNDQELKSIKKINYQAIDSSRIRFFFPIDETSSIYQNISGPINEGDNASIRSAEQLLTGKVTIFGREFNLGSPIGWTMDPITRREWPKKFWADLDKRDGESVGGPLWIWNLNRHHHMVTLGKTFFITSEERFAENVCDQLATWINENPPLLGINWASPMELAIRLINWTWTLAFIQGSKSLSNELVLLINRSIKHQANHIYRHLSRFSSANNHLIGEAAGLAVVGICFPHLGPADKWLKSGLSILDSELAKQIYPDGVPAEQSISYLHFVIKLNLLVWKLAELNGFDVPEIWSERLCQACEFIRQIINGHGYVPEIGDSDDGNVVSLDDSDGYNKYRSILMAGAIICDRPDFKRAAGSWDETNHWLFGEEGWLKYKNLPDIGLEDRSRSFPIGGYSSMKSNGNALLFDHGPLGYLSTAAHGHADALSLWLSVDNNPVLVDAGTYAYQEGGKWRDYFRGTSAHNTIRIEKKDQSEIRGTFLWGKKAKAQLYSWESNQDYDLAIGEHDGYKQLGIVHRRAILFIKPDVIVIEDNLMGSGLFLIEQFWHFSESCKLTLEADFVSIDLNQNNYYFVQEQNAKSLDLDIIQGQESQPQGWISKNYGTILPAPVLCLSGTLNCPTRITVGFCFNNSMLKKEISTLMRHAFGMMHEIRKE